MLKIRRSFVIPKKALFHILKMVYNEDTDFYRKCEELEQQYVRCQDNYMTKLTVMAVQRRNLTDEIYSRIERKIKNLDSQLIALLTMISD